MPPPPLKAHPVARPPRLQNQNCIARRRHQAQLEVVRFGNYDVLDLDPEVEKGFQPKRARIEGMIRHMRTPATGRTPMATVKGYKLHKRGSSLSETFNAAVVMSNSTAFAWEVKRTINQSGILSNSREQAFKVIVQNAPLEYGETEDETGGSELPSVTSATGPERSPRSLRSYSLRDSLLSVVARVTIQGGKVVGNRLTVPLDDIPSSHTLPYLYSCLMHIFQDLS